MNVSRWVEGFAALQELRPEWEALHARDARATPFQHPAWLLPWWNCVGRGELLTFVARSNGKLVALAPFYIYTGNGKRQLFPVGIGTTDYLDALCEPDSAHTLSAILEVLEQYRDRFDEIWWPRLRPQSPLLTMPTLHGWRSEVSDDEPCPVLTLPKTEVELDSVLPNLPRRKLRYYYRRAQAFGGLRVENADDLELFWRELERLHVLRWQTKREGGVLSDPNVRAMHAEALPQLRDAGLLRAYLLRCGEQIIGAFYGLCDLKGKPDARIYPYIGGFDPAASEFGPGSVLIGHALAVAARDGYAAVDFLKGQEPYKYVWGAQDTPVFKRRLVLNRT